MFSMGRDRRLPLGRPVGPRQPHVPDPGQRRRSRSASSRRIPFLVTGAGVGDLHRHRGDRDDLHQPTSCATSASSSRAGAAGRTRAPGSTSAAGARSSTSSPSSGAGSWSSTSPSGRTRSLFGDFGNDLRNTWSNPFINTFIKIGGTVAGRACRPGRSSRRSSASCSCVGALYYVVAAARQGRRVAGRGGRRDRRGGHRLTRASTRAQRLGRGGGPPSLRPRMTGHGATAMTDARERAARRAPRRARRGDAARARAGRPRPDAGPAVRRHHEPQLPGRRRRSGRPDRAVRDPPRRQRHPPAGDQPRGRARGDGRRRGRRAWAPRCSRSCGPRATSSPASSRARRWRTSTSTGRTSSAASPTRVRRFHEGPAIPGLFIPLRVVRGVPGARRGARRAGAAGVRRSPRRSGGGSSSR